MRSAGRFALRRRTEGDTRAGRPPESVWMDTGALVALRAPASRLALGAPGGARTTRAGSYATGFRGRGMDFAESRVYTPGDDVRHMDWRVTARTGQPHTKVFDEEREWPVFILVDLGPGMFFGTRGAFKSATAARTAALLAWAAVANGDRAGGLVFGGAKRHEVRPAGGTRGALRLLAALAEAGRPGGTPAAQEGALADALARTRRIVRHNGVVFVVSDFQGIDDRAEHHLAELSAHVEVTACRIYDAVETVAPPPGRYPLSDGERVCVLDTGEASTRRAWESHFRTARERLTRIAARCRIPVVSLATDENLPAALAAGLARRRRGGGARPGRGGG